MGFRRSKEDCPACFVKDCDCTCKTCGTNRERNRNLSGNELTRLNMEAAIAKDKEINDNN